MTKQYIWQCEFCGARTVLRYCCCPKIKVGMWRYMNCPEHPHRCSAPEKESTTRQTRMRLIRIDERPDVENNEFSGRDWLYCRSICETCVHYDNTQTSGHCCDIDIDTPLRYMGRCGDYEHNPHCEEYDPFAEDRDYSYLKDGNGIIDIR